jgi:hypothetical protein
MLNFFSFYKILESLSKNQYGEWLNAIVIAIVTLISKILFSSNDKLQDGEINRPCS